MQLEAGHVLAAKMNAHRHQWNGAICAQPQAWSCGADTDFRESNCANGVPRCFHLHVFDPARPKFVTPESTVVHAVSQRPALLDNQILVFYGGRFSAQQGIRPNDTDESLYGLYRVKSAVLDTTRSQHTLVIEPYADGWAVFPRVHLRAPTLRGLSELRYLKKFRFSNLKDLVQQALDQSDALRGAEGWTSEQHRRLQRASDALPQWLRSAEEALAKLPPPKEQARISVQVGQVESALAAKLRGIRIETIASKDVSTPTKDAEATPNQPVTAESQCSTDELLRPEGAETSVAAPEASDHQAVSVQPNASDESIQDVDEQSKLADDTARSPEHVTDGFLAVPADVSGAEATQQTDSEESVEDTKLSPTFPPTVLPESLARDLLESTFGRPLVNALTVAFLTKSLVILTGAPGAGKSWIASRLLDDEARTRTVVVPVSSTWRGREDLLGYVNPITGAFEASAFTHFLCEAQDAWQRGDQRSRLVVFEEFNLSQPEHWLSDLLVRLEYEPDQWTDRTVSLGGKEIAGRPGRPCNVVLVPSLRFVGTLNNDHTVKPLSPRVLDRAALIEVTSSGRAALMRAGVELDDAVADIIDDLNDMLEPRGAAFSVRSARSLQRALDAGRESGMTFAQALDLVLAQEVLSRVRLLAGDPRDEQLIGRLQTWTQKPGCAELNVCAARIADWAEMLVGGRDVFQA